MGELHLEVACSQLESKYKLAIYSGPMQVAYKESPSVVAEFDETMSLRMGGNPYVR